MNRFEARAAALAAINNANAAQKRVDAPTDPTVTRRYSGNSGLTDTPLYTPRVRDRQAVAEHQSEITRENAPNTKYDTPSQHERIEDARRARIQREKDESREYWRKRREEEERVRLAHQYEDERRREALAERDRIAERNFIRGQIRDVLADASAEEITEVFKRVRRERCELLPFAYQVHLNNLRAEQALVQSATSKLTGGN